MKYKFFSNVTTVEELKQQYKKLAFKHHPDLGGNVEDMQRINAEYDELFKIVGNVHKNKNGTTYTKKNTYETPEQFRDIINAIIKFNCRIEICGAWIWVFNAYAYKKQLKNLGFFYCSGKKAWAYATEPSTNKHKLTLDEIRRIHGSEVIRTEEETETNEKQIEVA